ncbi:MAG: alpha/beta hydrolase [Magnetococcales bacterium]|nr:alpha/beta hydrolase [Magnetococcales bacterium]
MQYKIVNISGADLAVYEGTGQSAPTLFLVHANSQDASSFDQQIDGPLGDRFRVVAIDLPGHGNSFRSKHPDQEYSLAGFARIISEVANRLHQGPTVYIGHSLGGHLLIQAAERLPGLRGLLALGTPPLQAPPRFDLAFLPHAASAFILQEHLSEIETDLWAKAQTCQPLFHERIMRIREAIRHTDPRCRSSLGQSIGTLPDECAILQRLAVPVALVVGERDPFINLDYCHNLPLPRLWRNGLHIVPGCGHSPQWEQPEEFNNLLTAFANACWSQET